MHENLTIELEYYKRNPDELIGNKDAITLIHGLLGYTWIKEQVIPCKKEASKLRKLAWVTFRNEVRKLTELQPLHTLKGFENRGFTNMHVDHITSLRKAFRQGWTPQQCADISNLQMLPYLENMRKGQ